MTRMKSPPWLSNQMLVATTGIRVNAAASAGSKAPAMMGTATAGSPPPIAPFTKCEHECKASDQQDFECEVYFKHQCINGPWKDS